MGAKQAVILKSERLVAANGSIYSFDSGAVRAGVFTRGRGFWTGREYEDQENPNVDTPDEDGAQLLVPPTEEEDAAFDDMPLENVFARQATGQDKVVKIDLKQAKMMAEAMAGGSNVGKSTLTLGRMKVDLLLENPEKLTEEQLLKSATTVTFMMESATNAERGILTDYASRLAQALKNTIEARGALTKAIFTKQSKEVDPTPDNKAKPPKKASETAVNTKGKVAGKYPKKGDGKGPNSDGWKGKAPAQAAPEDAQAPAPEGSVTPPPKVDSKAFCEALGIPEKQLKRFAEKKDRKAFVNFFMRPEIVEKHKLTPDYLGKLYDSIMTPEKPAAPQQSAAYMEPPQSAQGAKQPAPAPGPAPALPGGMKSLVVFHAGMLDAPQLAVLDLLKSHKAETLEDIRTCLQAHYACGMEESFNITRTLLNRWERQGVISIYPPKRVD